MTFNRTTFGIETCASLSILNIGTAAFNRTTFGIETLFHCHSTLY